MGRPIKIHIHEKKGPRLMKLLTCWLSWYDGGGTLWVAIIVTAGAGDACCIMGRLHIQTGRGNETVWIFFFFYKKGEKY